MQGAIFGSGAIPLRNDVPTLQPEKRRRGQKVPIVTENLAIMMLRRAGEVERIRRPEID